MGCSHRFTCIPLQSEPLTAAGADGVIATFNPNDLRRYDFKSVATNNRAALFLYWVGVAAGRSLPPLDYYQTLWSGLLLWITAAAPSHSTPRLLEGDPTGSLLRARPSGDLKEPLLPQIKRL